MAIDRLQCGPARQQQQQQHFSDPKQGNRLDSITISIWFLSLANKNV